MLEKQQTKDLASKYIEENLKEIISIIESAAKRWLISTLTDPSSTLLDYESKVDYLTHYYDFFYNLDTLLQLVQTGEDLIQNPDDLLLSGLQIYTSSF